MNKEALMDEDFAGFVRRHREGAGLSLYDAAELIGCTKSYLWDIEKNRARNVTITILVGISCAYGLDIADVARAAARSITTSRHEAVAALGSARRALSALEAQAE